MYQAPVTTAAPDITESQLLAVASRYKVDVSVARMHHEMRVKYPTSIPHLFDMNKRQMRWPCDNIMCCGLDYDSDIDAVDGE